MKTAYEYIVVGCGGIGSATAYWLARAAGKEVLGLEQFALGHDNGGSQDHSRIIRLSYHAPEYTALSPHTYSAWGAVEEESGVQLVFKTGGLDLAPIDKPASATALKNYAGAMRVAGFAFDELDHKQVMERFPQFRLSDNIRGLYQADSGLVDARKANAVNSILARARGATILEQTPVRAIRPLGDTVEVVTDAATFTCRKLVITSGSWTSKLLRHVGMNLPLTVTQEQITYFQTPHLREFAPGRFPIWIWHDASSDFYGFPVYGEVATKAGEDVGGDPVDPDARTFTPNPRPYERLHNFLETYIPGFLGPVAYTKTCLYDMPPDRNFIVGALPEHPQIIVGQGAAHGFKFAALLGKILSQLAVTGRSEYPIASFRIDRPALTDPTYAADFHIKG